ncbi:MAG: DUF4920 domain-containing protein [Planctomycetes bacterium]|nr:DUF4920 domain-containing protein [Planctomycetota bacterium]
MRAIRFLPVLTLAVAAAAQTPAPATPLTPAAPAAATQEPKAQKPIATLDGEVWDHFGTGITYHTTEGAAKLDEVLKNPEAFSGKTVRIEGPVTAVCQTKGCWMHLGAQQPPVMVKFKDYGFFMPKDASGRTAVVEGTMTLKQETVEQTKHYLEDAGKKDEAAKVTEGRKLFHFMASGVAMSRPKADPAQTTHEQFGAGVTGAAPLAEVLKNPEAYTGKTVRIEAPITAICQTKGCWMHLGTQEPPVMVKFKDYGFFMPKDASGRTAIVEGTLTMKQETVAETKHYLEDAGKTDEAAKVTEGRKLYHFMASGVAIKKAK